MTDRNSLKRPPSHLELVEIVYDELRRLAKAHMAREYAEQSLQATALVHEAWLRLGGEDQPHWDSRAQFFKAAAEAMRRILVDRARRRKALRHGGGQKQINMDAFNWEFVDEATAESTDNLVIELHEALEKLAKTDPDIAELVKLRYFVGMKIDEVAEALDLKNRTTNSRLAYARAWLKREIESNISI